MLSWLVEQALKCNKAREHRYQLSPGTWTPTELHPTHAKGECGMLMGHGAPLIHPGRAVAPVFTAFSKAAKSLFYLHLGVQQRSWCVWLAGSWGHGTGGSSKLYYLDSTYQILVREVPHRVWRTLFSLLALTTTTKERLPPHFRSSSVSPGNLWLSWLYFSISFTLSLLWLIPDSSGLLNPV